MSETLEVCPICDIAGCAHIREAGLKATIATQQERIQQLEAAAQAVVDGAQSYYEGQLRVDTDLIDALEEAILKENDNG